MEIILLFLIIAGCYVSAESEKCTRPNLSRNTLYVYSNIGKMSVQVNRCFFNDPKEAYSDISNNCINSFKSGVFIDKWNGTNLLTAKNTPFITEAYIAKADLAKNEIYLKSGGICRYDRGFCYDPTYGNTYAVVWEILDRSKVECASQLYKVFEGDADIWDFQPQGLSYLFYYDNSKDESFYLHLKTKGRCQENDVWYTEEGYIVSKNPLEAKDIEPNAALKTKIVTKGGIKGGVKGGLRGGRITYLPPNQNYFYLRPKKVVSENILENCQLLSQTIEEITNEVDFGYIQDPHNLRIVLKRYYDLIISAKENLLTIIKNESTQNLTIDLKRELAELSQKFENTSIDINEIQDILAAAGNLKEIRIDVDKLVSQITTLLKKNAEYDDLFEQLFETVKRNKENINDKDLQLQKLLEKLETLQSVSNQIPNLITKAEVYEKLNQVEQEFHNKVNELTLNVTLLLLQHEAPSGVKGKGTTIAELEDLILEKLRSFNLDQQQAAIDALKEKTELLIDQIRFECHNNASIIENKIMERVDSVKAQNKPMFDKITDIEKNIATINVIIENLKSDTAERDEQLVDKSKELQIKIDNILKNSGYLEQLISELRSNLTDLSEKEIDFRPMTETITESMNRGFKQRDERLDSLDDISAKLIDYIHNSTSDIDNLQKQINDTNEILKNMDGLRENITENIEKEVNPIQKKLSDLNEILDDHSKKHSDVQNTLEETKNTINSELDDFKTNISSVVEQINSTLTENSGNVDKLLKQDNITNNLIDILEKDLADQGHSITNLETAFQEKYNECEASNNNTSGLINNLKENVTELYDTIKQHEGSILELIKSLENVNSQSSSKNSVKTSSTKGGGKTSGTPVEIQEKELNFLRTQLSGAHIKINTQEYKIVRLEKQVEQLFIKIVEAERILSQSIESVSGQGPRTNGRIDFLEYSIKTQLATCCNKKSNYQGVKH